MCTAYFYCIPYFIFSCPSSLEYTDNGGDGGKLDAAPGDSDPDDGNSFSQFQSKE